MSKQQAKTTASHPEEQAGGNSDDALSRMDEHFKRREVINERIEEIKSEFGVIFTKRHQFQRGIWDLLNRLGGMPEGDKRYVDARQELTAKLKQMRSDAAQIEERQKKLDEELRQLQTIELPACMVAVCAEDVMLHQQRVGEAALVVSNIQATIDSQNQTIAEVKAAIPQCTNRQQERHDLLADIAMGSASEEDLQKLDAAINKEKEQVIVAEKKAAPLIENAKATVSGLERKLAAAKEALQMIESKSNEVAHRYYRGEAEKAAAQYVNHALRLKELHIRLLGLDLIIHKHDGIGIVRRDAKQILIPMFRLPQFDGLADPNTGDVALIDGYKIYSDHAEQAAEIEKTRFNQILDGHCYQ